MIWPVFDSTVFMMICKMVGSIQTHTEQCDFTTLNIYQDKPLQLL